MSLISWILVSLFVRKAFQSVGVRSFLLERTTYLRNHVVVPPQLPQTEESTYLYWTSHLRSSLACLTASGRCAWSYLGLQVNNVIMHFHLRSQVRFHREAALRSQYLWWDDEGLWPCLSWWGNHQLWQDYMVQVSMDTSCDLQFIPSFLSWGLISTCTRGK